jgi:hypothetical protein
MFSYGSFIQVQPGATLPFTKRAHEQVSIRHSAANLTKGMAHERPRGNPQNERSKSSRKSNQPDPSLRKGDDAFRILQNKRTP